MRRWPALLLMLSLLCAGCATGPELEGDATESEASFDTTSLSPDPRWTPEQVVRIVLISMKHNDEPTADSGIATAFRFASPASRARTGPLERFIAMVKTPVYSPLIHCRSIAISPILAEEASAELVARVIDEAGDDSFYYIALSRQAEGEFENCWMTDAVIPVRPRGKGDDEEEGDDDNLFLRVPRVQYVMDSMPESPTKSVQLALHR